MVGGALFGIVKAGVFGRAATQLISTPFDVFLGDAAALGMWLVFFLGAFIWVTFVWGLVNWLPIGGLDGWHILSALLGRWSPRRGPTLSAIIGLMVAVAAGAVLFQRGYRFAPLVFIVFALQQFRGLRGGP
jgi:membrane-associated protease RseP (regulator of RpoE activity)